MGSGSGEKELWESRLRTRMILLRLRLWGRRRKVHALREVWVLFDLGFQFWSQPVCLRTLVGGLSMTLPTWVRGARLSGGLFVPRGQLVGEYIYVPVTGQELTGLSFVSECFDLLWTLSVESFPFLGLLFSFCARLLCIFASLLRCLLCLLCLIGAPFFISSICFFISS